MGFPVIVSGLKPDTTAETLEPLFLNCGAIRQIIIQSPSEENCCNAPSSAASSSPDAAAGPTALIMFVDEDGATIASMLDNVLLQGMTLRVQYDGEGAFCHKASAAATGTEGLAGDSGSESVDVFGEPIGKNASSPKSNDESSVAATALGVAKKGASVVAGGAGIVAGGVAAGAGVVVGGVTTGAGVVVGGVVDFVKGSGVTGTATTQQYGGGFQPQWGSAPAY